MGKGPRYEEEQKLKKEELRLKKIAAVGTGFIGPLSINGDDSSEFAHNQGIALADSWATKSSAEIVELLQNTEVMYRPYVDEVAGKFDYSDIPALKTILRNDAINLISSGQYNIGDAGLTKDDAESMTTDTPTVNAENFILNYITNAMTGIQKNPNYTLKNIESVDIARTGEAIAIQRATKEDKQRLLNYAKQTSNQLFKITGSGSKRKMEVKVPVSEMSEKTKLTQEKVQETYNAIESASNNPEALLNLILTSEAVRKILSQTEGGKAVVKQIESISQTIATKSKTKYGPGKTGPSGYRDTLDSIFKDLNKLQN
tara:strand:- start:107 stop:1051 length:945 start_codon:yes stop_codon:yes gene_type:complete